MSSICYILASKIARALHRRDELYWSDVSLNTSRSSSKDSPASTTSIASSIIEIYENIRDAIAREKQIKGWRREKKVTLIESMNPQWLDLAAGGRPAEIPRQARNDNSGVHHSRYQLRTLHALFLVSNSRDSACSRLWERVVFFAFQ